MCVREKVRRKQKLTNVKMKLTWVEREMTGDRGYTERNKRKRKGQTDLRKEEGRQSSNPRRESESESW